MTFSIFPDPLKLCRQAVNCLEDRINSLADSKLESPQVAKVINRISSIVHGVQHITEKTRGRLYKRLDLPSLHDVAAIGDAVQRVEDKLDQLLPQPATATPAARPARTRRPPEENTAKAPARRNSVKPAARRKATPSPKAEGPAPEATEGGDSRGTP